jgi:putative Holliday junction resolvase
MTKILGLDYGDKTIGVSVSLNGRVATGVATLRRKDANAIRASLKELKVIVREHEANKIILGYPKNMDGEESTRCAETLAFKEKLEKYLKKDVVLWDERLSTRAVTRTFEGNRVNYKKHVDTMAAVYILQGYLDYINTHGEEEKIMANEPENFEEFEDDDESDLVIVDENGNEHPLTILASQEDGNDIYLLAAEDTSGTVYHFKCQPAEDDDDEMALEQIDKDHEDFKRIYEMFKEEYEALGIDVEDIN